MPVRVFYCYVLHSKKTGRRYVGSCEDLDDRIVVNFVLRHSKFVLCHSPES